MKSNLIHIFVIPLVLAATVLSIHRLQAQQDKEFLKQDHCYLCHKEMDNLPPNFSLDDVHIQEGLSCAGCHGGDPTAEDPDIAMDPARGFVGTPTRKEIPGFCGKCHSSIDFMRTYRPEIQTDQVQQYYTSVHGKRLLEGDQKVAECVSCHHSHDIRSASDGSSPVYPLNVPATCNRCHGDADYMAEYGIPTNQYEEYKKSVHGKALLEDNDVGSPACNDCHGNHGATPPGVESVAHVCGNCHVNNMDYFLSSPMAQVFEDMDVHACEQCHGNHLIKPVSDEMAGVGKCSVCTDCHTQGDKGYKAADEIHSYLATFVATLDTADSKLKKVQQKGMYDVDILYQLKDARQALIQSRTLVHTFDPPRIKKKVDEGVQETDKAIMAANSQLKEYVTRKRGYGAATIFIIILTVALFLKIRNMDRREIKNKPPSE